MKERRRTARERIWATMRVLKKFDVPMLMMTAEANRRSCEDFINLLARAGYVRTLSHPVARRAAPPAAEAGQGRGLSAASRANLYVARDWSTYQLVRSTGPRCPTITNPPEGERELIDPNTGASVPIGPGLRSRAREVNHVQ